MTNGGVGVKSDVTCGSLLLEHVQTPAPEFDLNRTGTYSESL